MKFLTIDPGWSGAVAFFDTQCLQATISCPTSREPHDMMKALKSIIGKNRPNVYIERVWSRPYERGAFSFGQNYGIWLGVAAALNLKIIYVLPKEWQDVVGKNIPKDYAERKNYFKKLAQKWVGKNHKVTLKNADAICIGMYIIKKEKK